MTINRSGSPAAGRVVLADGLGHRGGKDGDGPDRGLRGVLITRPLRKLRERGEKEVMRRVRRDLGRVSAELRPVLEHITARFYDVDLTLDAMERDGVVDRRLRELFREEIGVAIKPYLLELKADLARWLLAKTDQRVKSVSGLLGYSRPTNFTRDFGYWTGESPAAFRAARRQWSTARRGGKRAEVRRRLCERLGIEVPPAGSPDVEALAEGKLFVFLGGDHAGEMAELLWEILREEVPSRQLRLLRSEILFGGPELFELLSRKSREIGRRNRKRGVAIAELALAAVEGSAALLGEDYADLVALGLARLGNALRLAGDLRSADEAFEEVWSGLGGAKDRCVEAEISALEGTLRLFERRYDEALELLDRAIEISSEIGEVELQVSSLLQRVALHGYEDRPREMLPDLEQLLAIFESRSGQNREDLMGVYQELALAHLELGNLGAARRHLRSATGLCEELDHCMSRHQLQWIEGRLAGSEENEAMAERMFRQARAGFLDLGDEVTGALVSVDLAILCHGQGRLQEVMALVTDDVIPILEAVQLQREASVVLRLLQEAVAIEAISLKLLWQVRKTLRQLRQAPG